MAMYSGGIDAIALTGTMIEAFAVGSSKARVLYAEVDGYTHHVQIHISTNVGTGARNPVRLQPWDIQSPMSTVWLCNLWTPAAPSSGTVINQGGYHYGAFQCWFPRGLTLTTARSLLIYHVYGTTSAALSLIVEE
jgi:hypothetical protein